MLSMTLSFALFLISGLLALLYLAGWPPRRLAVARMAVKAGSVLLLAIIAFLMGGSWLLIAALAFGALGDAFLVHDGKPAFIGGLASFLIAHIIYAALFLTAGSPISLFESPLQTVLPVLLVTAACLLLRMVWEGARGLHLPVILYALAILGMTFAALATGRPGLITGALLFFASDAVLALEKFRIAPDAPHRRLTAPFVWTSYYLAQLLILLAWSFGY